MSSELDAAELDAAGHYPGCATHGCEVTDCRGARERAAAAAGMLFDLRRRPDASPVESRMATLARDIHALGTAPDTLPIGGTFALYGRWRVYFNRHGAAGKSWCIAPDAGGWEVAVGSVNVATIAETVYRPKATPDDEDDRPSAWFAVDGYLTVHASGHATIGSP